MKLFISGGGTGGHINPALAVADEFKKRDIKNEVLFFGTKKGLESRLVPERNYDIKYIDVEGFQKNNALHSFVVIKKLLKSILECKKILKREKPDIVVGTGGYVSAPLVISAHMLNIPIVILEQNAICGKTTNLLSKFADKICLGFNDKSISKYPEKCVFCGNPVREEFKNLDSLKSKEELGLSKDIPFIICVSGSLGAKKINDCTINFIKENHMRKDFYFLAVTGDLYYNDVVDELKALNIDIKNSNIFIKNYISDIGKYLSAADLVISRAGALFLSEIAYLKKPSLLIPSPNVAENHQEKNAINFEKAGAAVKISECDLNDKIFGNTVKKLIGNKNLLLKMSEAAKKISVDNSAEMIVDIMYDLIK